MRDRADGNDSLPSGDRDRVSALSHLAWVPLGALVGSLAAFVFGDLVLLPVDVYYLVYFSIVLGFLAVYVRATGVEIREWVARRWLLAITLGVLGGLVLMQRALMRPETTRLSGGALVWVMAWRGVVYGTVDGLLLFAFPWIVVWRAFGAEGARWRRRIGAAGVALAAILLVTATYHLGYRDFRSPQILQPNIGSSIGAVPTLLSTNPTASVLSHVFLHVTAVVHSPETDLFLPPHRD